MKTYGVRLLPDEDLKKRIVQICAENQITSACVLSAVGSLKKLNLRLANSSVCLEKSENFEVLSLNGTVSVDGIHLHIAVSDSKGQVFGGHLLDDNIIYTTCELVLMELSDTQFTRVTDSATGFKEIVFT
ncbi:MAG: DNA-binding protein [Bdellovibrio sp.]|nr:DNA-binding protein [Bdellovibrio sp.]